MSWKVPYIDYPAQYQKMREDILQTIDTMLCKGNVMLRQELRDFEDSLASFVGARWAVGTSNCTDALRLSLIAADIGPGDEVITVSHTFVATASAIHHVGATPILVDIGPDHNMDPVCAEDAITECTKAILPVHLNGRICDMTRLTKIAQRHEIHIIEDAAQALGASIDKIRAGAFGLAGCFSFYPAKLLGTYGDGGAVVTDDEEMAHKISLLRDHGRTKTGDVAFWSFNCRLDNLHGAILNLKLKQVPEWIEQRRSIAQTYHELLSDLPECSLPPKPAVNEDHFDVFENYEIEADDRNGLMTHLEAEGIETLIPWGGKGIHHFEALGLTHFDLPRTDRMFARALMLPMHCELSYDQIVFVGESIRRFYGRQ